MHRLVVWLPKSAETLTSRIAKVGHGLRVSSPAWSIQRVLDEAVQLIASPDCSFASHVWTELNLSI
jgi:hypothetical protein